MKPIGMVLVILLILAALVQSAVPAHGSTPGAQPAAAATFTITGRVTDNNGNGLPGVTVEATLRLVFLPQVVNNSASSPAQLLTPVVSRTFTASAGAYSTVTDSSGNYRIPGVPAGEYFLVATKPGNDFSLFTNKVELTGDIIGQNFLCTDCVVNPPLPGELVPIPPGTFQMGCDPAHNGGYSCDSFELPLHTVNLDGYRIDKYEVTNGQYALCVAAGSCGAPATNASNSRPSYYGNPVYANYPVMHVTWNNANSYCSWAGLRLPTEAEWEKAARGPSDVRAYPWGDALPSCTTANHFDGDKNCIGDTSAIGSFPAGASPYGVMDMAGNVWEWVNDWFGGNYYSISPADNPPGPTTGTQRVMRGGAWVFMNTALRNAKRGAELTSKQFEYTGFRCAKSGLAPNIPAEPVPANGASGVSLPPALIWTGGDLDGDAVTYNLFFEAGDSTPDVQYAYNQAGTSYYPGHLTASTTYYWQVVAKDAHGESTSGPIWRFSTSADLIRPGEMVLIPAGTFQMGCDPAHNGGYGCDDSYELPLHTVNLSAYRIGKYEVTNGEYASCVTAGSCTPPATSASNSRPSYYGNPVYTNYPVMHVTWNDATSYCTWAGLRLPTEAEWEKAARGPSDVRAYPWGDALPSCTTANHFDGDKNCVGDTSAIGSFPAGASPYGVMDMAGNVWEWVNDWFGGSYYSTSPASDPPGPATGSQRVFRGGGWVWFNTALRNAKRAADIPTSQAEYTGFRCAAPPLK